LMLFTERLRSADLPVLVIAPSAVNHLQEA
jgi:hypothetical protein